MLVTGGAGFIGSNLVEAMLDGHEVKVLGSFNTGRLGNLKPFNRDIKCSRYDCLDMEPEINFNLGILSSSAIYRKDPYWRERS